MNKQKYHNIIVRMPNWLGDLVMATPVLADIHTCFPDAKLTAMCQGNISSLLIGTPYLDEIFQFSRPKGFLRKKEKRELTDRIMQGKYDLGILLTNSFSSAWWFWRGGVQERLGYSRDARKLLLTQKIPFSSKRKEEHLVTSYKHLLTPLEIPLSETSPKLFLTQDEKKSIHSLLSRFHVKENAEVVGINPLAAYGLAKCWPQERFRALVARLAKDPNRYILLFGDTAGAFVTKEICHGLSKNVIDVAGQTSIRQLMALISVCNLFITNDSGPMHVAAALKTPLIAIFGSTNEKVTGPYKHGKVIHKHVECSPCYLRKCPIDFRCMTNISVDEIYETASEMLKAQGR